MLRTSRPAALPHDALKSSAASAGWLRPKSIQCWYSSGKPISRRIVGRNPIFIHSFSLAAPRT